MIAPSAVKSFLRRPLPDYRGSEWLDRDRLNAAVQRMDPKPRFHTKPYGHQLTCFVAGMESNLNLLLDPGLGKTKIALDLFRQLRRQHETRRVLVMVPTISAIEAWREQSETHLPMYRFASLSDTNGGDKWAAFRQASICVATYAGALWLLSDLARIEGAEKKKLFLVPESVAKAVRMFRMVVYDEITAIKNHRSSFFKMAKALQKGIPYRYGLTGTPFGKDPHDLWAEFNAVDGGESLGYTLGIFRAAFFRENINYWGGYEYEFRKEMKPDLKRMMAASSVRFRADDCVDLPKRIYVKQPVVFSEEQKTYYESLREAMRKARGKFREVENAWHRMRQMASGFLSGTQEGVKRFVRLANPKMEALVWAITNEIPPGEPVIVFHEYIYSGAWLYEELVRIGPSARLYSGTKNKAEVLRDFNSGKVRFLIGNSASVAMALNLQRARYAYIYESPVDPIIREQMEKRIHRVGQTNHCVYTDFYVKGSVEERILESVGKGRNLLKELLDGKGLDTV